VTEVFFVDRSLGRHVVARALRIAGALVEVHDDHFAQDAPDEVWLPEVGRRGWAVLTKDERIRYRDAETTAAITARVALFIFTGKGMRGTAIADALVKALPAMRDLLRTHPRPFVAKVTRGGAVTLVT
jgi:PIN like domain